MASPLLCNPFNEGLAAPAASGHATGPFTTRPEALEPAGHPNFVRALTQNDVKVTPESSDAEPDPEAGPVVSASPSPPTHYAAPLLHPVVSRSTSFVELPELYKVNGNDLVPNPVSRSTSDDTLALPPPPRKVVQPMRRGKWSATEVALAELLIELFKAGRVPGCREGTTLRAFLAAELRCERMRISKKYAAGQSIGKLVFRRVEECPPDLVLRLERCRAAFRREAAAEAGTVEDCVEAPPPRPKPPLSTSVPPSPPSPSLKRSLPATGEKKKRHRPSRPPALKVHELRAQLASRGLSTEGLKGVLKQRLRDALANPNSSFAGAFPVCSTQAPSLDINDDELDGIAALLEPWADL